LGLWRIGETMRMGYLDFRVANPWRVNAVTLWPRAVLQCLFFTVVGQALAGGERDFAFVGATVLAIALSLSVGVASVLTTEKVSGTMFRTRLAGPVSMRLIAARAVPWVVEALVMFVLATVCVGLVVDRMGLALAILRLLPVFALMALSNAAAGLALATIAVGRRAEVLYGNALTYLIIAAGGVVVPTTRLAWLDAIGAWLPLRNGLLAVRGILADRPWAMHLLAEVGVCLLWSLLAVGGLAYLDAKARRSGVDAFE